MDVLKQIVLLILAISFMISLIFFGRLPLLRNTPIGMLYKLIWVHFPRIVSAADQRLTSGRLTRSLSWLYNRILYERHPTIVIFFLAIMMVSEYMYIPPVWPQIGFLARLTATTAILMPYVFLYLSCSADPGFITAENHSYYMSLYPYDYANFHPGIKCRTCRFLKPPRSKHCDLCKRCVARADHHCVFINSCVGYGNHHWFLLLLGSTAFLTSFGGLLGLSLLTDKMKHLQPGWSLWPPPGMEFNRYLLVWAWGLNGNIHMGAVTLLALLTSPLVCGLFVYSLFLVYCGTTTNESMKWSDYKEEIADGYAYRRPLRTNRIRDARYEPPCRRWPTDPEHVMLATQDGQPPTPNSDCDDHEELDDDENGGEEWTPELGRGKWERVKSLRDVENLYDRGFWHNLCDIFVGDYTFGMHISPRRTYAHENVQ